MRGQPLKVIQSIPEGSYCAHCVYQPTGIRRVLPDGSGSNGVALVGDSPWESEAITGKPFVGASGKWLDTLLSKRGLRREDFLITNGGTQCKPPSLGMNDNPEDYPDAQLAQRQCRPYLDELIAERKPKVLVALGNVALRRLTGFENVESNNGYVIQSEYGIPVVPTFHPSGIIQGNWNLTIAVILSIARAMEIASGTFKYTPVKVIEDPDPSYLEFPGRGDITQPLMCDIETPKSLAGRNEEEAEDDPSYQIIRMGFSVREWQGVSFLFDGDYIRAAKALIRRARVLIFWNKNYDLPRLIKAGFVFHPDVTVIDAMWAWHWLHSDLPKALAFAAPFIYCGPPWKHLASQRPAFYNGSDNAIQMGVYQGIKSQLERDGRWDRFWSHCVKVDPIYVRMGQAGVKVDVEARKPFMEAMEKEALAELVKVQELVPAEYARRFPDKVVQESYKELKLPKESAKVTKRMYQSLVRVEKIEVPATHKDGTIARAENGQPVMRPLWRRYIPFNPRSRPDMLRLMHCLGVKPPKARGEDRESVEAKYLKRLTKFPIFRHCVNYSQRSKLISTYNWPLKTTEISIIEEVRVDVSQRPNKKGSLVGIEGERSWQVKEPEVETGPRVQKETITATKSPLGQIDPRREASLRQKDASLQRCLGKEAQALEESRVQSNVSQEASHSIHVWGSWVGPTPSSEELSKVSSVISGREAMHPSLGLGRLEQRSQQLSSRLCFVPQQVPSNAETYSPFLLPITRTITSTDRATSTYGFHPSTLRSSSRNVNLGNIPKRFELAKLFRRLLIAERGCKLIEIDRSGIEAVLVGHWAKSPAYINLAKAGVHSMLVSHVIGRPVPDNLPFDELKRALKAIKKEASVETYEGCKRCIHGSNYLLSPYGLHDEYEEFFPTEYDAQKMQDLYFGTPAGQAVRAWHKATIEEAYSKKYLDNSFEYRHYFYGPMYKFSKRERKWIVDHEGDAKRAVAFRPQSDAAAIQRNDLLALELDPVIRDYIRLPTYDSLVVECPTNLVDKCCSALYTQFSKPIEELGGLTIGFEIKVGDSLGDMQEISL